MVSIAQLNHVGVFHVVFSSGSLDISLRYVSHINRLSNIQDGLIVAKISVIAKNGNTSCIILLNFQCFTFTMRQQTKCDGSLR